MFTDLETTTKLLSATAGILGVGWSIFKFVWKPIKAWAAVSKAKIKEELDKKEDTRMKIEKIFYEFSRNSGSSLADLIHKTAKTVDIISTKQRISHDWSNKPVIEFDSTGRLSWTNKSLHRILGDTGEILGFGYKNYILEEDRENFLAELESCIQDKRDIRIDFRLVNSSNNVIPARLEAVPLFNGKDLNGFYGCISLDKDVSEIKIVPSAN